MHRNPIKVIIGITFALALCLGITLHQHQQPPASAGIVAQEKGYFDLTCYDAAGNLKWQDLNRQNALADEGEQAFLDMYLRGATPPTRFYIRLLNSSPSETTTLATMTGEPTHTNGYQLYSSGTNKITRDSTGWPTLALDSGDYQAVSKTWSITAVGGTIGPVTTAVLSTTADNTGKLVAYVALSATRTLQIGDTLQVTYKVKLQ